MAADEAQVLREIRDYMKVLVRMTANEATKGQTKTETIETLLGLGLDTATICEVTGFPSTTVAPIVSRKKKALAGKA